MTNHPLMKCGCAAQGVLAGKGGVKFDQPIPACVVHECYELADNAPDLTGRMAACAYLPKGHGLKPSDPDNLAFFEYRGAGSQWATNICKCGYAKVAHDEKRVKCREFVPRGPSETDSYYCGCHGWD